MGRNLCIIFFLSSINCFSQKVFSVDYPNQADIKIFVVPYENQADLKVHRVEYKNQATGNKGLWHFVDYPNQADKKVYFAVSYTHLTLPTICSV